MIAKSFTARLNQASLATKGNIADFVKTEDFNDKLKELNKNATSNKLKHLLIENEFKKLQDKIENLITCDSSLFNGQSYFFNDGAQLYLIFQRLYYTLKY